ncbi:hypothetical protein E2C01_074503 [Portunus trituberculatus]|uniref:Uncharacterized protein n=1 Tax=Portunus trituberculatus TaxID=210409 RepID=A0A5B7ICA8_PORTR|nr:hypothetical protein [Portunus trituberculatus]
MISLLTLALSLRGSAVQGERWEGGRQHCISTAFRSLLLLSFSLLFLLLLLLLLLLQLHLLFLPQTTTLYSQN